MKIKKFINYDLRMVDNMKGKIVSISLIAIAWLGAASTANGYEIDCPAKINIKFDHPELENIPEGWQVSDKKERSLALSSCDDNLPYSNFRCRRFSARIFFSR